MKILLVFPPHLPSERYNKKMERVVGAFPPLGLLYIAAVIRKQGYDVKIIDGGKHPECDVINEIKKYEPDIVGISSLTFLWDRAKLLAKKIKETFPNIFIVMGGPHPTILPIECMKDTPWIDGIVVGEGEEAFLELITRLEKNESLSGLKGLIYRDGQKIIQNQCREPPQDLNKLPFPARDLIKDIKDYVPAATEYKRLPVFTVTASRGCPFRCLFCSNITGKIWRWRDPENVMKEIDEIVENYGAKDIYFFDDTFTVNKKWVMEICDLFIERNYDLIWSAQGRANTVDKEILSKMKKAGCWKIFYGFESCLQKNLDVLRKGITVEQIERVIKMTQSVGIEVEGSFILGIPGETYYDGLKTIELIKKFSPDYAKFYPLTPLPGTDLIKDVNKYGKILVNDLTKFTEAGVVFTPHSMTKKQLEFLVRQAFRKFYLRPEYILKRILKTRSLQDINRGVKGLISISSL